MYAFPGQYMPRVGSRQASLNKLIWCALLCYLLCSGDKIHTFREQFATGAGRGKKMQSVSCAAKYDPKGRETRILGQTVRMKIESCFLF